MQGVFIYGSRPPTKKYLTAQIAEINLRLSADKRAADPSDTSMDSTKAMTIGADPYSVVIEATSLFGDEFDGSLAEALRKDPPQHGPFNLVGPDPRTSRKWYATITFDTEKGEWQVS